MPARPTRPRPQCTHARWWLALAVLGWLPGMVTAEPRGGEAVAPANAGKGGAWQRVQHGPTDAITLVRERQAAERRSAGEAQADVPRSGFVAEHGGIAWQLEGGGRLTVRRRHRTPMLFYRSDF